MTIYDQLLQFSLFQGMSRADLMEVVTHTKFGFSKLAAGKTVVKEGNDCKQLFFLTNGTIECETQNDDRTCRVVESISAPYTLQPERLFGLTQRYTSTFKTITSCNLITLDKQEVLLLLETQLVFRLNMLNLLAADFFSRCIYPAGPKTFYILMQQLGRELNDSRLDISKVLNEMQSDNLISLHRGRIEIPTLEQLLM